MSDRIVGVGGLPRSGKDTVADFLIAQGWFGFSFGDFTRQNARVRHSDKPDPISVANMTETSNWLREMGGPDVILKEALGKYLAASQLKKYAGLVLYSVRAPIEVDWILEHEGELIWVETSEEVRYQRAMQNMRSGEAHISFEEFKRQEALQWEPQPGIPLESQMNISYVKQKASKTIVNNSNDLAAFKNQIATTLNLE